MRKVLNVGGNSKQIALPPQYADWEHVLLDIDPSGKPDIICDARKLDTLEPAQFDAVYCSHNLEHYYRHEVNQVLQGFLHVLKADGFIHIRVPDIKAVMKAVVERDLDLEDVLYQAAVGPIMVLDVLYGWSRKIEESGDAFFAHKTGFTQKSLIATLNRAGFSKTYTSCSNLEIRVIAFREAANAEIRTLFSLSD